jgi:hypothetical protein
MYYLPDTIPMDSGEEKILVKNHYTTRDHVEFLYNKLKPYSKFTYHNDNEYYTSDFPFVCFMKTNKPILDNRRGLFKWTTMNRKIITVSNESIGTIKDLIPKEILVCIEDDLKNKNTVSFKPNMISLDPFKVQVNNKTPYILLDFTEKYTSSPDYVSYIIEPLKISSFVSETKIKISHTEEIVKE